jgi:hypothetical protein
MFSWTLSDSQRLNDWKMKPTLLRRTGVSCDSFRAVISTPSTSIVPGCVDAEPPSIVSNVILPEPDGP